MLRVLLRPRVIQTLVSPACITHWQIGSCRGAHKGGKRTWAEEAQRELAAIEKKRRRRIANARLRNWAADENLISYISVDLRNRETVREQPISADERWRRQLGQLRARHNSRKANQGRYIGEVLPGVHVEYSRTTKMKIHDLAQYKQMQQ